MEWKLTPPGTSNIGSRSATWVWELESLGLDPSFPRSVFFLLFAAAAAAVTLGTVKDAIHDELSHIRVSRVRYIGLGTLPMSLFLAGLAAFL